MTIQILLSARHKVVAEGIAAVLRQHPDIHLMGVAEGEAQARQACEQHLPQVLVLGIDARGAGDISLIRWASQLSPRPEILVFSAESDRATVLQMMQAGAAGFVSTCSSMDELLRAIRALAAGRTYLCPVAGAAMVDGLRRNRSSAPSAGQLGEREEQVLCLIADGYSSKEIARNLQIAPSTVEVHRRNIMRKVGLHKVADLTRYAIRHQMVSV